MHCNNPWKKKVTQKVKKRWNMTVNLALTQQWLQLTCIHCKCGAEPFTFSCSISGCRCHYVISLGTCCHLLACFSPLTSAPPLEPNLRELEGGAVQGRAGKESTLHIPQQKHCFLHSSPQEHRLSWGLLCSTPCILPMHTNLLSEGCLTHSPPPVFHMLLLCLLPAKILPNQHDFSKHCCLAWSSCCQLHGQLPVLPQAPGVPLPHKSTHPSALSWHQCLQTAPAMHKPAGSDASGHGSLPAHFPSSMLNHNPCPRQTRFYSSGKCRQNICLPQPLPISPCRLSLEEHLAPLQWVLLAKLGFTGVAYGSRSRAISQGLCLPTKQSPLMGWDWAGCLEHMWWLPLPHRLIERLLVFQHHLQ